MKPSYSDTLVSNLLDAADLLTVRKTLEEIGIFLSESSTGRGALCKVLSKALLEQAMPFAGWTLLNSKRYVVYPPAVAIPIYLWMHGLAAGTMRDTAPRVRKLVGHIDACFAAPSGNRLTEARAKRVLHVLQAKFPYIDIVSKREPLRVFLFDNCHRQYNSEYGMGTKAGQHFVFMYHMRDSEHSPEYVFLHELGHALHASINGTLDTVPEEFMRFDEAYGGRVKQGSPEAPEVFADLFAIAAMRGTELSAHDPFGFPDDFKGNVELFIKALLQKYSLPA